MTDTCDNSYKFRLHPLFDTTRSSLLVHPDGGIPGTAGCIGVQACTMTLREFLNTFVQPPPGDPLGMPVPVYVRP